jgi:O-antigen biosynthesis protein
MANKTNKACFILPAAGLSGGIYVVFEHAIRINKRSNFDIYIVMEDKLNPDDLFWFPEAKEINWLTFEEAKDIDFDAVISTWWETCYEAYRLKSKAYLYFNQSVESKFYEPNCVNKRKFADSTYYLNLKMMTEASWIKEYLYSNYGISSALVLNGIRKDLFKPDGPVIAPRSPGKIRVLVEGPLNIILKNTEKTIDLCLNSDVDEVWFLTSSHIIEYQGINRVFSRVPFTKTAEIYRSCDVLVKLSYVEGMFGPPLEMFHCGGTAIVYDVTGHDEYIVNDYNAYVVEIDYEEKVVEYLNKLKNDQSELNRLKKGALATAASWHDWDMASLNFENALVNIINSGGCQVTKNQLEKKTIHFKEWYDYCKETELRLSSHEKLIQQKDQKINSIQNSFSWKLGRLITWLPRMVLKVIMRRQIKGESNYSD